MRVFFIAEAGVNHGGDLKTAHRLVDAAAAAGADAVKFQTFHAGRLASAAAGRARYQAERVGEGGQRDMLRALELRDAWHAELASHCGDAGLEFMSTPFDLESVDLLAPLVSRFKVGSGDLTDHLLLDRVARAGRPVILSTGMSDIEEIAAALSVVRPLQGDVTLLHCTSLYPAPPETVNLRAISGLRERFGLPVGYSDHTLGTAVALAAVGLGAAVLEKHFTLDRAMKGPDHAVSLEPGPLRQLVESVRELETALGDGRKRVMPGEAETRAVARKSLVAAEDLPEGTVLARAHLAAKRPGTGISPAELGKVMGATLRRRLAADELLTWEALRASDGARG